MNFRSFSRPLTLALVLFVATVLFSGCLKKKAANVPAPTPTPAPEKFNTVDITERPFVVIEPSTNGRNLTLTMFDLKKPAAKNEFEIDYQSGSLLQGAFGRFDLKSLPNKQDILLGSCSAGGKCSYHEDVSGGSLILRLSDPEKYVLKNEWSFLDNKSKGDSFSSRDGKFVVTGTPVKTVGYAVVLQSPGYPQNPEQSVLSSVYSVGTSAPLKGKFTVSVRLNDDSATAAILAWDGTKWQTLKATVQDKVATATADKPFLAYVAVATQ